MTRFRIEPNYWRKPRSTQHRHRNRILICRARNGYGTSPGWHIWFYTYPKDVQRGRLLAIYGRWVSKP